MLKRELSAEIYDEFKREERRRTTRDTRIVSLSTSDLVVGGGKRVVVSSDRVVALCDSLSVSRCASALARYRAFY